MSAPEYMGDETFCEEPRNWVRSSNVSARNATRDRSIYARDNRDALHFREREWSDMYSDKVRTLDTAAKRKKVENEEAEKERRKKEAERKKASRAKKKEILEMGGKKVEEALKKIASLRNKIELESAASDLMVIWERVESVQEGVDKDKFYKQVRENKDQHKLKQAKKKKEKKEKYRKAFDRALATLQRDGTVENRIAVVAAYFVMTGNVYVYNAQERNLATDEEREVWENAREASQSAGKKKKKKRNDGVENQIGIIVDTLPLEIPQGVQSPPPPPIYSGGPVLPPPVINSRPRILYPSIPPNYPRETMLPPPGMFRPITDVILNESLAKLNPPTVDNVGVGLNFNPGDIYSQNLDSPGFPYSPPLEGNQVMPGNLWDQYPPFTSSQNQSQSGSPSSVPGGLFDNGRNNTTDLPSPFWGSQGGNSQEILESIGLRDLDSPFSNSQSNSQANGRRQRAVKISGRMRRNLLTQSMH